MRQLFLLILLCISLYSCDKDESSYTYSFDLVGEKESLFSEKGESREFSMTVFRETKINGSSSGHKEAVEASIISSIDIEGEQFNISNITKNGTTCRFKVTAAENQQNSIQKKELVFTLTDTKDAISKTYKLQQKASLIERQYTISADMAQPFMIPAEGGHFEIDLDCQQQKSINGRAEKKTAAALKGLRYSIVCANSSAVHSVEVEKASDTVGKYTIVINSTGPYNLTQWSSSKPYKAKVIIQISDGDDVLFYRDIIQPQTQGEDYLIQLTSLSSLGTFDI